MKGCLICKRLSLEKDIRKFLKELAVPKLDIPSVDGANDYNKAFALNYKSEKYLMYLNIALGRGWVDIIPKTKALAKKDGKTVVIGVEDYVRLTDAGWAVINNVHRLSKTALWVSIIAVVLSAYSIWVKN